jgi:hypothetical protein
LKKRSCWRSPLGSVCKNAAQLLEC